MSNDIENGIENGNAVINQVYLDTEKLMSDAIKFANNLGIDSTDPDNLVKVISKYHDVFSDFANKRWYPPIGSCGQTAGTSI